VAAQPRSFRRENPIFLWFGPSDGRASIPTALPEKTRFQSDLMLVALEDDVIVGSVMTGYDGHRGWISRIAVLRSHQKNGIGQALISAAEERLDCIKVNYKWSNLTPSLSSSIGAGYQIERRISMSKLLRRD
jgi:ribosomal protein S18 acetylase RimI-like enzyme